MADRLAKATERSRGELYQAISELELVETSENNFGVGEGYGEISLLSKTETLASIMLENENYLVEWDNGKQEISTSDYDENRKFIKLGSPTRKEGKLSLLVGDKCIDGIEAEDSFFVDKDENLFFVTGREGRETFIINEERQQYKVYEGILTDRGSICGKGYMWCKDDLYFISDDGKKELVTELPFNGDTITRVTAIVSHDRLIYKGVNKGLFQGETIKFYFNPRNEENIPYKEINGTIFFLDEDNIILSPEGDLVGKKLDMKYEKEGVKGFEGKTIYKLGSDDWATYTDGKGVYSFHEDDFTLYSLKGKKIVNYKESDDFHVYKNLDSDYNGYPLSIDFSSGERAYGATSHEVYGEDYVIITDGGVQKLILFKNGQELIIDITNRDERETKHSINLGEGRLIGLYTNKGIIVLGKDYDDEEYSNSPSTSHYRYYSINPEGSLTYIGSKDNVSPHLEGDLNYDIGERGEKYNYSMLQDTEGFPISYMKGKDTFIAVKQEQEGKKTICLLLQLTRSEGRQLNIKDSFNIPEELLEKGKVKNIQDVQELLQYFGGSNIIYNPSNKITLGTEEYDFCNIRGKKVNKKINTIEDLPTVKIANKNYYILLKSGFGNNQYDSHYLFSPQNSNNLQEIENIESFYSSFSVIDTYAKNTGLKEVGEGQYIYPKMKGRYPDNLRLALISNKEGEPNNTFVLFGEKKGVIKDLETSEYPIETQKKEKFILKKDNGEYVVLNIKTGGQEKVSDYDFLHTFVDSSGNIEYSRGDFGVVLDAGGNPVTTSIEGEAYYVLEESEELDGKEVCHLCNASNGQISPFYVEGEQYISLFEDTLLHGIDILRLQNHALFLYKDISINKYEGIAFAGIGKMQGEDFDSLVYTDFLTYGNVSLVQGQKMNEDAKGGGSDNYLYICYKGGEENICEETKYCLNSIGEIGDGENWYTLEKYKELFINFLRRVEEKLNKNKLDQKVGKVVKDSSGEAQEVLDSN